MGGRQGNDVPGLYLVKASIPVTDGKSPPFLPGGETSDYLDQVINHFSKTDMSQRWFSFYDRDHLGRVRRCACFFVRSSSDGN